MKKNCLAQLLIGSSLWRYYFIVLSTLFLNVEAFSQFYERDKVVGSSRGSSDFLGDEKSVALWGDFAAAGTSRSNINGNSAGAVYVYQRSSTTCQWDEIHTFVSNSSNPSAVFDNDNFGQSVAMGDNYLVIGASGHDYDENDQNYLSAAGAIFIYERIGSTWSFMDKVVPNFGDRAAGALFGHDVDIVDNLIIVGAYGENNDQGAAYIFELIGPNWVQQSRLTASDGDSGDEFGYSVAISSDWAAVGAPRDEDGTTLVPGSVLQAGSAYTFLNSGGWVQNDKVTTNVRDQYDWFGYDVEIDGVSLIVNEFSDDDNLAGVTNPQALQNNNPGITFQSCCGYGSVHYFNLVGLNWTWNAKIQPANIQVGDWFGSAIALDGNFLAVGAYRTHRLVQNSPLNLILEAGAVYVFELVGGVWQQVDRMTHSDRGTGAMTGPGVQDYLGKSVAFNQNRIIASAPREDENDDVVPNTYINHAGSAYIFEIENPAEMPILSTSISTFCSGSSVNATLMIDNSVDLNDATEWEWTTDPLLPPFASGPSYSINVNLNTSTTYWVRGVGCGITPGPWGSITITSGNMNSWHQYTKFTAYSDVVNDVITDSDGNVYITGTFRDETVLNGGNSLDISMVHPFGGWSAFVAKYNPCGDLLWADYSIDGDRSDAKAITLDEDNGIVYITGDASLNSTIAAKFNSTGVSVANSTSPSTSFVAAFDMQTGDANYVEKLQSTIPYSAFDFETNVNTITINESNGEIYIGGAYYVYGNLKDAFVQKYSPSTSSINSLKSEIQGVGSGHSEVNDLDYFEGSNPGQLAVIGDYRNDVRFVWTNYSSGSTGMWTSFNNFNMQGFLLHYQETGGSYSYLLESGSNSGGHSTGNGIAFDETTGKLFLTGDYTKNMINPYNLGANSIQVNIAPNKATYLIGYDVPNGTGWTHDIVANDGSSHGVSVAADAGMVYFTGDFTDDILVSTGPSFTYTGLGNRRAYIISLNDIGGNNWGNVTIDPGLSSHAPTAIAVDNDDHVFVCGSFWQDMDYLNGVLPALSSSGAGANGFVLRAEKGNGQLRVAQDMGDNIDTEGIDKVGGLEMVLHPNPTSDGKFNIVINELVNGSIEVTNVYGQHVYKQLINKSERSISLDLSGETPGVYFVTLISNGKRLSRKISFVK